jgi:hypothetical protein
MIVYHGSFLVVKKPDIGYSKSNLDFGAGFYVTADRVQAEIWAKRKAVRQNGKPIVNTYNLTDDLSKYKGLVFANEDVSWLDFVAKCRKGKDLYKEYDYVSGSVANDDVFMTVDMYMRGIWDSQRALSEIRYYKTSHQICLITKMIIDNELSFVKSYEVK